MVCFLLLAAAIALIGVMRPSSKTVATLQADDSDYEAVVKLMYRYREDEALLIPIIRDVGKYKNCKAASDLIAFAHTKKQSVHVVNAIVLALGDTRCAIAMDFLVDISKSEIAQDNGRLMSHIIQSMSLCSKVR